MVSILTHGQGREVELNPLTRKYFIELKPPNKMDNQADVERVRRYLPERLRQADIPLEVIRKLPSSLREANWGVTITTAEIPNNPWIINVEPGRHIDRHYGLALDIGTTTIVIYLVDLNTGHVLAKASEYNGQIQYGEDILTRIHLGSTEKGLQNLRRTLLGTINQLVGQIAAEASIDRNELCALTVAGNTTMIHLFLGLEPTYICREPYTPVVNSTGPLRASAVGVHINPQAVVYCLPCIGSYVGGDVIAGVLVSGMYEQPYLSLLVDIGTNGEIVLGNCEWLVACAGAAGPALEGGAAAHGMRAEKGAINRIKINPRTGKVDYQVIGGGKAKGICGSGLVDCLAELLLAGIIDRSGHFIEDIQHFVVAPAEETATGKDIIISQKDIKNLLRTKAAVNAAVEVLMEEVGCSIHELKYFYSAGAFGEYMDRESAVTIGLYPDLPRQNIICLGNSSIEGAKLVLLSQDMWREVEALAKRITYFELNNNQKFMEKYTSGLFLPHADLSIYPTVKKKLEAKARL
ncbi:ASKHA domain-containing protein [Calderihabitans maritimus]|uniref:Ferredoxin n=1 Tax=Calderihabitans maritimus TaxID=1246530 RepID=A0A1Z5HQM5_9FIRM|nr:ASKHA domain-containing protein [Calderihabitans maritimus]GAW91738.1 ferredoxin [Calderihabitans maritimus]